MKKRSIRQESRGKASLNCLVTQETEGEEKEEEYPLTDTRRRREMKRTDELAILSPENNSLNEEDTRVRSRGRTLKKSKEKEMEEEDELEGVFSRASGKASKGILLLIILPLILVPPDAGVLFLLTLEKNTIMCLSLSPEKMEKLFFFHLIPLL